MKKHIVRLTGEMASGKSTAARHLIEKYNATSHRFSTSMRDVLDRLYIEQTRKNLGDLSTVMRSTFGEDIFAKIIFEDVSKDESEYIVVDGIRRLEDIRYLRNLPEFKLIYVKAGIEERYGRITNRDENADDKGKSFEQFQKEQLKEAETQIKSLEEKAEVGTENDGTLEELFAEVDRVMES